jgi:hypothetical protein
MKDQLIDLFLTPRFLLFYGIVGGLYCAALPWLIPSFTRGDAFFTTLGLLTGGDPFTFRDKLLLSNFAWIVAWVIHGASWLIIPILVGLVFNKVEERKKRQRRRAIIQGFTSLAEAMKLPPEGTQRFVKDMMDAIDQEG